MKSETQKSEYIELTAPQEVVKSECNDSKAGKKNLLSKIGEVTFTWFFGDKFNCSILCLLVTLGMFKCHADHFRGEGDLIDVL